MRTALLTDEVGLKAATVLMVIKAIAVESFMIGWLVA